MKKIAIQGHPTRGKDVIKILKSLGGNNLWNLSGIGTHCYYYINDNKQIDHHSKVFRQNYHFLYDWYTLEEYEQKFLNNMENKRNIQIDLNTAKEWYNQGGDLRKIALQAFSENELETLPSSWKEYCEINPYLDVNKEVFILASGNINPLSSIYCARRNFPGAISSKKRAEQFLTLNKLLQIRDYYNQGWTPNWEDEQEKYTILTVDNKLHSNITFRANGLFTFKTKELRDEFYTNFKEDLEFIKEFL